MDFDLAGHVRLAVRFDDRSVLDAIAAEMDPYAPGSPGDREGGVPAPAVVLTAIEPGTPAPAELQLAAGDGFVTGSTGKDLYLLAGRSRARVPDAAAEEPAVVAFDRGFPVRQLFRHLVRPALQLRALAGGSLACHAAAVDWNGSAILVAGWSESGKTETALALAEAGGRFVSDKWTFLAMDPPGQDGASLHATPFPIGVGVRRWALQYLPHLRGAMPARTRLHVTAAGTAATISGPFRRREGLRGAAERVRERTERVVALADRVALAPSEIAAAYGHPPVHGRIRVGLVVVLRTVPGPGVRAEDGDIARLSRRLAASAVTERQGYFALRQRATFAIGSQVEVHALAMGEAARLQELLAGVPVVEVSAPFPTDPRAVVDALVPWLPQQS
jgi:hypothetical protein